VAKVFAKLIQLEKRKPDIILTSFPTESLCLESVRYGLRFQIPVVLDMRDMWPDILVDTFPRGLRTIVRFALSPVFRKAQRACEEATAITGITDAFIEWGLKKANRAKSVMDKSFPLSYSSTLPPENDLRQAEKYWDNKGVPGKNESFNVCFFGTLGWQLDIDTVILAARKIRGEGIPINFILCGMARLEYYPSWPC
jgi:glycosyltransferase involved in cell wall biosynthesis